MNSGLIIDARRVLVVDDDDALLRVTSRILGQAGFTVHSARNGAEASRLLAAHTFDAILSDVQMPGMDGVQLLRAARERDADLQIVLLTGAPDVTSASAAVEYGAFQYLIKPVDAPRLLRIAGLAVDATRAARLKRTFVEHFGSGRFQAEANANAQATLDHALTSLWIAYQPIVRRETHTLFACEALMRTDESRLPHPGALLSAAHDANRLHELGRTVRARVASDLSGSPASDLNFFVNLHAEDLADPMLLAPSSALSLLAPRVVLELTERHALDLTKGIDRISALRQLGYRIALDNLGGGYAGLSSFAQLEPDFIKLDASLVRGAHESAVKRRLIRAMVDLCHEMERKVIAEGVETEDEQATLEELGCDFLQGYRFGKPTRDLEAISTRA
jgi:EAL domain-containing protein (putative c-di-GMP-specific phosphodiesterase class I)/ActR/RegA family two-component response regulator